MTRTTAAIAVTAVSAALALAGCRTTAVDKDLRASVEATPVNAVCPVGGHEIDPGTELTHVHDGKTVGFCCEGCHEAWPEMTIAERDEALAAVLPEG